MYVFPRIDTSVNPVLDKSDPNKEQLLITQGKVSKVAVEQRNPLNFYILCEENDKHDIKINGNGYIMKKAVFHTFITKVADEVLETQNEIINPFKGTVVDLYAAFGKNNKNERTLKKDDTSMKRMKQKEYTFEEQILPDYNRESKNLNEVYTINKIFSKKFLECNSGVDFDSLEISQNLKVFFKTGLTDEQKNLIIILDCLQKFIVTRKINFNNYETIGIPEEVVDVWENFLDASYLNGKFLTQIGKDKLVIIYYILVLKLCNNKGSLSLFPKFGYDKEKILLFLKTIGCTVSNETVVFSKKPDTAVTYKRRRTMR